MEPASLQYEAESGKNIVVRTFMRGKTMGFNLAGAKSSNSVASRRQSDTIVVVQRCVQDQRYFGAHDDVVNEPPCFAVSVLGSFVPLFTPNSCNHVISS